jgi:hypothetical protein
VFEGDLADPGSLAAALAVEASGLDWTHLRPGEFAANRLALWGQSIRAERVVRWPFPDEAGIPIHEADIAAIAAAIGEDVRLEQVSREEALRQLREQGGWAAVNGPFLLGYEGFSAGSEYPEISLEELAPLPTVERVTGRPAAPSPAGLWTTPATSAEVSRPGAPGGCGPRSGRRGRGSGRTRSGRRSDRG